MATITASRTEANLRQAFAAETLASRRYLAYAARAEADGFPEAASLFRSIAERRSSHAQRHIEALELCGDPEHRHVGSTAENVRAAIMHEVLGCSDFYPPMARRAHEEGLEDVAGWFEALAKASRSHAGRFRRSLENLV